MNRSSHAYYYDLNGNRTYVLDTGLTTNYSSNSVNAYTSITGSTAPTYDLNGTGRGRATRTNRFLFVEGMASTLVYDKENRLRSITRNLGGSVNSYTYDALGRISTLAYSLNGVSTTEVYTWTGWTLLYRELIQNAAVVEKYRYTWGLDVSGTLEGAGGVGGLLAIERNVNNNYSWDTRYPHYDANGNIMALSNSSGQISARYRYDAFGKTILSTDVDGTGWNTKNIHGFSTKPTLGNHKLHYYGYRWYDASNGRWINRDPIEEKGGLNLYGFVGNDGVNWWDYLGHQTIRLPGQPGYVEQIDNTKDTGQYNCAGAAFRDYAPIAESSDETTLKKLSKCRKVECKEECPLGEVKFTFSRIRSEMWLVHDKGDEKHEWTGDDWHVSSGEGIVPQKYGDGKICYRPTQPEVGMKYPVGRPSRRPFVIEYRIVKVISVDCYCCPCDDKGKYLP
jgi:RHS repeat-associated protein